MVMGGLWFGEHKPVMKTFLKPFQEALSLLETEGIYIIVISQLNAGSIYLKLDLVDPAFFLTQRL